MGQIEVGQMQWYAVRVKRKQVGGIRTTTIGGKFETYRDRQGRNRMRRMEGTGQRVFVPEHLLRRAGFEVFLPIKKEWRRKNRFSNDKHLVAKPLMADWLFVGWPVGECLWSRLMELDVVTGVLGTGGRPVVIKEDQVARLMRQWGGGWLTPKAHRYAKTQTTISVGDMAHVAAGPFEGASVRVVDIAGPSVRAVVKILGGEALAEFCSEYLELDQPGG